MSLRPIKWKINAEAVLQCDYCGEKSTLRFRNMTTGEAHDKLNYWNVGPCRNKVCQETDSLWALCGVAYQLVQQYDTHPGRFEQFLADARKAGREWMFLQLYAEYLMGMRGIGRGLDT